MKTAPDPLAALRDVHTPPFPELWPPAPGWWALALLMLAAFIMLVWWGYRRYRVVHRRRRVLATFDQLGERDLVKSNPAQFAAEVSSLLKRVALERFPRANVAKLNGVEWLEFLDNTGGDGRFNGGPGRVLAVGPYAPYADVDAAALLGLAKDWVRRNNR